MILENVMLNEISPTQKDKHCVIPLIWVPRIVKSIKTGSKIIVTRDWVFQFGKMKTFWRWWWLHNNVNIFNAMALYILVVKTVDLILCIFYYNKLCRHRNHATWIMLSKRKSIVWFHLYEVKSIICVMVKIGN